MSVSRQTGVRRWRIEGEGVATSISDDRIATELPVALTYNRVSHVVMMASPCDLEDLGLGFSLTEGLIGEPSDLLGLRILDRQGGVEVAMTITEAWFDRLATQRRNLAGRTGCGLCGAENIEQALRSPARVGGDFVVEHAALQRAIRALETHQPLQAETGAAHGAAWCNARGEIQLLREDVGRHNALDKLIGALYRGGHDRTAGFALVSSRASYEMVYKAAAAGIELIVAVSAPTTLAVEFAQRCGVTLVGFARPGRHNIYTFENRISNGIRADE